MKKIIYPALVALAISTSAFTVFNSSNSWRVKQDAYSIKFTADKFEGTFSGLQSELIFDENNPSASRLMATIDANSVNTGNGMRNKHAKQGLDSENFQTVKFSSTSIEKSGNGYVANGKLTIKDVTRDLKIPFSFTKTSDGGVFTGNFTVKPAEYNVTKSGTPEVLEFQLNIPVSK